MRRVLLWLFVLKDPRDVWERAMKVAAQLILLSLPFLAAALLWRVDHGLAACVGMMSFGGVAFIATTWYRWNVLDPRITDEEREARRIVRRSERSGKVERWRRHIRWLAAHDKGKRGEIARSIVESWKGAQEDKKEGT